MATRINLFKMAGIFVVDSQWTEAPMQSGEIRVYSQFCDRLEFSKEYTSLAHRRQVAVEALQLAATLLAEIK